jgi:hypothetical protein
MYLRGADGAIMMFDHTDPKSLEVQQNQGTLLIIRI